MQITWLTIQTNCKLTDWRLNLHSSIYGDTWSCGPSWWCCNTHMETANAAIHWTALCNQEILKWVITLLTYQWRWWWQSHSSLLLWSHTSTLHCRLHKHLWWCRRTHLKIPSLCHMKNFYSRCSSSISIQATSESPRSKKRCARTQRTEVW